MKTNRFAARFRSKAAGLALSLVPVGLAIAPIAPGVVAANRVESRSADDLDVDAAKQLVIQNCLMCHSDDLIVGQRLTPKQWAAEVDKMIGWGSPLPVERKGELVAYLSATYSDQAPRPTAARIGVDEALSLDQPDPMGGTRLVAKGDSNRGAALHARHCATCHGADAKGGDLGTNLVEKPVLLREAEYLELMRQGRRRMPGFGNVLNAEAEADILAWLRSRRT